MRSAWHSTADWQQCMQYGLVVLITPGAAHQDSACIITTNLYDTGVYDGCDVHCSSLVRGLYDEQVRIWRDRFPTAHLCVMSSQFVLVNTSQAS